MWLKDLLWMAPATSTGHSRSSLSLLYPARCLGSFWWDQFEKLHGQSKRWQTQRLNRIPDMITCAAGPDEFPEYPVRSQSSEFSQSDQNTSLLPEQGSQDRVLSRSLRHGASGFSPFLAPRRLPRSIAFRRLA